MMKKSDAPIFDIDRMRAAAGEATGLVRSLAHEDRLLILCRLALGEACVSELEADLGIRQPTLSQQLGVLRRKGFIAPRREGKHIHYRIADARVLAVLQTLHALYCSE